jgi:hypothetical protein
VTAARRRGGEVGQERRALGLVRERLDFLSARHRDLERAEDPKLNHTMCLAM